MVSRSILALFGIALFIAVAIAAPAEEVEVDVDDLVVDEDAERGLFSSAAKKLLKEALKVVGKELSKVNPDCLTEIAKDCENPLFHPQRFVKCAEKYFLQHKEYCYNVNEVI